MTHYFLPPGAVFRCPGCGSDTAEDDGMLELWHDETNSGWQCHRVVCQDFGVFGEDDCGPQDPSLPATQEPSNPGRKAE